MFFSLSFCLIPFFLYRFGKPDVPKFDKSVAINIIGPTFLEFIGQIMFLMGSMDLPVSLSLTLKGARVVFSAIFLVVMLKRKLFKFHWVAVACTVVGLVIASIPQIVDPQGKNPPTVEKTLIGIALVLGGELIRSFKSVFEERLLKKLRYDALMMVGTQGLLAFLLTIPLLAIVSNIHLDGKPLEDFEVTMSQFKSSGLVIGLSAMFPLTVSALFIAGMYVTKLMSSVHNALTGIITTAIVWMLTIIIHFIEPTRGVELKVLLLVQLLGFVIVFMSSLVYDAIIRLPKFYYPTDRTEASGAGTSVTIDNKDPPDVKLDDDISQVAQLIGVEAGTNAESDVEETETLLTENPSLVYETSPVRSRK